MAAKRNQRDNVPILFDKMEADKDFLRQDNNYRALKAFQKAEWGQWSFHLCPLSPSTP